MSWLVYFMCAFRGTESEHLLDADTGHWRQRSIHGLIGLIHGFHHQSSNRKPLQSHHLPPSTVGIPTPMWRIFDCSFIPHTCLLVVDVPVTRASTGCHPIQPIVPGISRWPGPGRKFDVGLLLPHLARGAYCGGQGGAGPRAESGGKNHPKKPDGFLVGSCPPVNVACWIIPHLWFSQL